MRQTFVFRDEYSRKYSNRKADLWFHSDYQKMYIASHLIIIIEQTPQYLEVATLWETSWRCILITSVTRWLQLYIPQYYMNLVKFYHNWHMCANSNIRWHSMHFNFWASAFFFWWPSQLHFVIIVVNLLGEANISLLLLHVAMSIYKMVQANDHKVSRRAQVYKQKAYKI